MRYVILVVLVGVCLSGCASNPSANPDPATTNPAVTSKDHCG